jgi:uncharacterized protein (TIGR00730 family)
MAGQVKSVCVYCGSSGRVAEIYKETARQLGTTLGKRGITLVYGGGRVGLMGIVADAALAAGGPVVGIIPDHLQKLEVEHTKLTELVVVDSMHTRKRMMVERSDGFIVLPGGLGTLDEMFEVLTWKQLRLHDKAIVILNADGYWDGLLGLIDGIVDEGFAQPQHRNLFVVADSVREAIAALDRAPEPVVEPELKWL